MLHPKNISLCRRCVFYLALGMLTLLTGCQEVNTAIDSILGKRSPILSTAPDQRGLQVILAKKRPAGEIPATPEGQPTEKPKTTKEATPDTAKKPADKSQETKKPAEATAPPAPAKKKEIPLHLAKGKKRAAGAMPPTEKQEQPVQAQLEAPSATFTVSRDPFKAPTEILPSECPPSMPLCKFDFSQLKLVGVIQVEQGQFKGMVEDPDGRGYFITPGMQIGGATVTQVTNKGIILHVRKTRQDVNMPLFLEAKESQDF